MKSLSLVHCLCRTPLMRATRGGLELQMQLRNAGGTVSRSRRTRTSRVSHLFMVSQCLVASQFFQEINCHGSWFHSFFDVDGSAQFFHDLDKCRLQSSNTEELIRLFSKVLQLLQQLLCRGGAPLRSSSNIFDLLEATFTFRLFLCQHKCRDGQCSSWCWVYVF